MKRVKSAAQAVQDLSENGTYALLGLTAPDPATIERLAEAMDEEMANLEATLPKPWAEMTRGERIAWLNQQGVIEPSSTEVQERYGNATVVFFGPPRSRLPRGSLVRVQEANGDWRNQMVAVGSDDGVIYVTNEREWRAAQAEGREPLTTAYPHQRVALAEDN